METESGTLKAVNAGTTRYSAKVPSRVIPRWVQLVQWFGEPSRQFPHWPQPQIGFMLTLSPSFRFVTPCPSLKRRGPFMPHDERERQRRPALVESFINHHVTVTDSRCPHLYQDLAGTGFRHRQIPHLDGARLVADLDYGFHFSILSLKKQRPFPSPPIVRSPR